MPPTKPQIEQAAIELYAQGTSWQGMHRELRERFGAACPSRRTLARWREANPAWDAARETTLAADAADDLSVAAEIARLRRCRARINGLLGQASSLSPAEVGELKTLLQVESAIEARVDPDRMLDWLERFLSWCADDPDRGAVERIAAQAHAFAEATFGEIDLAAERHDA